MLTDGDARAAAIPPVERLLLVSSMRGGLVALLSAALLCTCCAPPAFVAAAVDQVGVTFQTAFVRLTFCILRVVLGVVDGEKMVSLCGWSVQARLCARLLSQ